MAKTFYQTDWASNVVYVALWLCKQDGQLKYCHNYVHEWYTLKQGMHNQVV